MLLCNTDHLSKGSHKIVDVLCDVKKSDKCRVQMRKEFCTVMRDRSKNEGKDVCLYCFRLIKFSGRSNPNCKFKMDDAFFATIDSREKAYILGFIASDGSIPKSADRIDIEIHKRDKFVLSSIAKAISDDCVVKPVKNDHVSLSLCSQQMVKDVCRHLEITPGAKSSYVRFPNQISDSYKWDFIRGYFDGDGSINNPAKKIKQPRCKVTSNSAKMLNSIRCFCGITCSMGKSDLWFSGNNALDFLGKLYDNATIYMPRKRNLFLDWSMWQPALPGLYGSDSIFKWVKTREDAVAPTKARASDSGFDLVVLEKVKNFGDVELWDTGIKVCPEFGWYFEMVPRSSISKRGYILANLTGVIDRSYTGNILVALVKIDPKAKDIESGERLVQIIPRPIIHVDFQEVEELDDTDRGTGGYGSTGEK